MTIRPRFPLCLFVQSVWATDGKPGGRPREWVLPTASTSVLINLTVPKSNIFDKAGEKLLAQPSGAFISGPRTDAYVICPSVEEALCGIEFTPGGAAALLKSELEDMDQAICELAATSVNWGIEEIEHLQDAPTQFDQLETLCHQLLHRLDLSTNISPTLLAGVKLIENDHSLRVDLIAHELGVTSRRLRTIFSQGLGISPKKYARQHRFRQVVDDLRNDQSPIDWADRSLSWGFSDQSHLSHECRDILGGATPSILQAQIERSTHPHHIATA